MILESILILKTQEFGLKIRNFRFSELERNNNDVTRRWRLECGLPVAPDWQESFGPIHMH